MRYCYIKRSFFLALFVIGIYAEEYEVEELSFGITGSGGWFYFEYYDGPQKKVLHRDQIDQLVNVFGGSRASSSYMKKGTNEVVSMTLHTQNTVSVTLIAENFTMTLRPNTLIENANIKTQRQLLTRDAHIVTFRSLQADIAPWCKVMEKGKLIAQEYQHEVIPKTLDQIMQIKLNITSDKLAKTKQDKIANGRVLQTARRWENCYSGDSSPHYLDIGIIIDRSFYASYNLNQELTLHAIEAMLTATNLIYYYQLNIFIRARQLIFAEEGTGGATVGDVLGQLPDAQTELCSFNIDTVLEAAGLFSRNLPVGEIMNVYPSQTSSDVRAFSHWHVLSACFQSGAVGIAFVDTLCNLDLTFFEGSFIRPNVAVSSRNFADNVWLTFAHEVGHAVGASHSFEEGQGKLHGLLEGVLAKLGTTGGIMDYGDGRYEGIFQFNEKYRREEICSRIDNVVNDGICTRNSQIMGEGEAPIDFFETFEVEECQDGNSCLNGSGVCIESTCLLLELKLSANFESTELRYDVEFGDFSPQISISFPTAFDAQIVIADPLEGCVDTFNNADEIQGNIVVIQRGTCFFQDKVRSAENAGAIAAVIANNNQIAQDDVFVMAGAPGDGNITDIPAVMISYKNGNELKALIEEGGGAIDGALTYIPVILSPDETSPKGLDPAIIAAISTLAAVFVLAAAVAVFFIYRRRYSQLPELPLAIEVDNSDQPVPQRKEQAVNHPQEETARLDQENSQPKQEVENNGNIGIRKEV